jgi:hypothetical protein
MVEKRLRMNRVELSPSKSLPELKITHTNSSFEEARLEP